MQEYFQSLEKCVENVPPDNILNFDETNLSDDPGASKCIFRRGIKYPERVASHKPRPKTKMINIKPRKSVAYENLSSDEEETENEETQDEETENIYVDINVLNRNEEINEMLDENENKVQESNEEIPSAGEVLPPYAVYKTERLRDDQWTSKVSFRALFSRIVSVAQKHFLFSRQNNLYKQKKLPKNK
ncbi:hypothetical protein ILUMI_14750 [Ignelater luminosus]|uniref:Uncharacterized protein n=1 Tax=Ignelater luminosus TaxID=2038154 RepID=A0A8K0CVF1_IGNLU|nr:hypothetical protein ILUMI_14750 [Ignelater luminosus]